MRYKKLLENQLIYCPVLKSILALSTDELENISMLSKFILFCIGNGANKNKIKDVTMLQDIVIEEEISLLQKEGIIETDFLGLTELGNKYFKLIMFIDNFNKQKYTVQIDQTTGKIIKDDIEPINRNERNDKVFSLQDKLVDYIYRNKDAENSKEFFMENFNTGFSDAEKEIIHIDLLTDEEDLYREMKILYVPCESEENTILTINENLENFNVEYRIGKSKFFIEKTYIKFNIDIESKTLRKYENIIKEIQYIHSMDKDLLSDKALNLINTIQNYNLVKSNLRDFYLDGQTGEILSSIDLSNKILVKEKKKMILPQFYDVNNLNEDVLKKVLEKCCLVNNNEDFEVSVGKTEIIKKVYEVSIYETIDFYINYANKIKEFVENETSEGDINAS